MLLGDGSWYLLTLPSVYCYEDLVGSNRDIALTALYDDRSIRAHVYRTRELLSISTLHASVSTSLALQHEMAQNKTTAPGG